MNILLTNLVIGGLSGTERHVLTLARALLKRGHVVAVYSPTPGEGDPARVLDGVRVSRTLEAVGFEPDVLHCHHLPCAIEVVMKWPHTPSLYLVHDATEWHDALPPVEAFDVIAAVDRNCAERAMREAPGTAVQIVPNPIEQGKLAVVRRTRRPRSLLIYGKSARDRSWNRRLRLAALANGVFKFRVLEADRDPLGRLGHFDIILARARCAMEACLSGAYTVLFDRGLCGGSVTPENVEFLLGWNFGRGVFGEALTYARFKELLRGYSADSALDAARILKPLVEPDTVAASFESLYRRCIAIRAQRTPSGPLLAEKLAFARALSESIRPRRESFPSSRVFFGNARSVTDDGEARAKA